MQTTTDKLLNGRVTILQPEKGYRVAVDPVLLAAAVPVEEGDSVLDLGSGTGAVSFCLQARVPGCKIVGLENNPEYLELARQSAVLNNWREHIQFIEGRVEQPPAEIPSAGFDWVVANPPYFEEVGYSASPDKSKSAAHARSGDLQDWIDCAVKFLKPAAWFFMIYPADEDDTALTALNKSFREIRILRMQPKADQPTKRLILAARREGGPVIKEAGTLVLHEEDGKYSAAAHAVLWDAQALKLL